MPASRAYSTSAYCTVVAPATHHALRPPPVVSNLTIAPGAYCRRHLYSAGRIRARFGLMVLFRSTTPLSPAATRLRLEAASIRN